jgi:proteasome accessory factor B
VHPFFHDLPVPPNPKTQRWLDLIAFLVGRRFPVSQEQVMQGVAAYRSDLASETDPESVRRKFERDKRELRRLGIPLETVDYVVDGVPAPGYRIRSSDFYLPYLRLLGAEGDDGPSGHSGARPTPGALEIHPDELAPAVEGLEALAQLDSFPLRLEARSALGKLTFDLAETLVDTAPPLLAAADPVEARRVVEALTGALSRRKSVTFEYRAVHRDQTSVRRVHPYGLLFKFNHWYLVGRDLDRDALRTFRVSRMADLEVNGRRPETPDFEPPADLDLSAWSRREAWDLPGAETPAQRVVVRFAFPRSLWAERNGHGTAVGGAREDGSLERSFEVRQPEPFLRWLLTLEGDADIVEPLELRSSFQELAARVAALYDEPGPDAHA